MGRRVYLTNLEIQVVVAALTEQLGKGLDYLNRRTGDKVIQRTIDKMVPPKPKKASRV